MKRCTTRYVAGAAITAALALGGVGLANAQSSDTADTGSQTVTITDSATDTDVAADDVATDDAVTDDAVTDDGASVTVTDDATGTPAPGDHPGRPGADGEGRGRGPGGGGGCDQDGAGDGAGDAGTTGTTGTAPAVVDEQAPTTVAPSTDSDVSVDAGDL